MLLVEKIDLNRKYKDIMFDLERFQQSELADELYNNGLLLEDESSKLTDLTLEWNFFNSLYRQTRFDNIISLIKISERLGVELDCCINFEDIDYDIIWDTINEQIPISNEFIDFMKDVDDFYDRIE